MELIVEVVHPQVKLKATCKALTMGARLDFDAILQQTYFALCLWESVVVPGIDPQMFSFLGNKGEPVCRTRSTLKEVFPRDLTCRDHQSRADFCQQVQWFAPLLNFLVLRPLNHFSSASRCDGGS